MDERTCAHHGHWNIKYTEYVGSDTLQYSNRTHNVVRRERFLEYYYANEANNTSRDEDRTAAREATQRKVNLETHPLGELGTKANILRRRNNSSMKKHCVHQITSHSD